jgi:hypothetical protein
MRDSVLLFDRPSRRPPGPTFDVDLLVQLRSEFGRMPTSGPELQFVVVLALETDGQCVLAAIDVDA